MSVCECECECVSVSVCVCVCVCVCEYRYNSAFSSTHIEAEEAPRVSIERLKQV